MTRLRICFEIDGMAEDEHGEPCPTGLQLDLGEVDLSISYEELTRKIDCHKLLEHVCLKHIPESNVRVITPEEYDEKYGED